MITNTTFPLPPGSTIGIMGGGQLGRMTALAAATLGYRCHIFSLEKDSPAEQVSASAIVANYDDLDALKDFANSIDVVTFEFENIPFESVQILETLVPVRPSWNCLRISQDRLIEKDFITGLGIATTPYHAINNLGDLRKGLENLGHPAVLKTRRLGYDGKGQVIIDGATDIIESWDLISRQTGEDTAILEAFVNLSMEISVIVGRSADGDCLAYPAVDNSHKNHILDVTRAPAQIPKTLATAAEHIARTIADAMGLVGLLAVEMFILHEKKSDNFECGYQILVNEIAPRPHNSGHWTMDACATCQFEQFVRAVAGLPLGSVDRHHDAIMVNLIGEDLDDWLKLTEEDNSSIHIYGKTTSRPGRKMGHVNRLYPIGGLPSTKQRIS